MTDPEIYALENKYGVHGIDSEAHGLKYFFDGDRRAVGISGQKGMTGLTIWQAVALCRELPGILQDVFGVDVEEYQKRVRVKKS